VQSLQVLYCGLRRVLLSGASLISARQHTQWINGILSQILNYIRYINAGQKGKKNKPFIFYCHSKEKFNLGDTCGM
jgi:hypothetical protein